MTSEPEPDQRERDRATAARLLEPHAPPDWQERFRTDELHLTRKYREASLERFSHIPSGGNRFDIPDRLLSPMPSVPPRFM